MFLLGSSCGPGLEKPQVRVVGLMATAPPFNAVVAGGCAGAAVPWVAVEGPVAAEGGAELLPSFGCSKGESDRGGVSLFSLPSLFCTYFSLNHTDFKFFLHLLLFSFLFRNPHCF